MEISTNLMLCLADANHNIKWWKILVFEKSNATYIFFNLAERKLLNCYNEYWHDWKVDSNLHYVAKIVPDQALFVFCRGSLDSLAGYGLPS